jgi:hypothetical protein
LLVCVVVHIPKNLMCHPCTRVRVLFISSFDFSCFIN